MIVTLFPEFSLQCINNSYLLNIGWLQRHYVFKYSPNDPIRYILYSPIVKIRKLRFREGKYLRKSTQLLRGGAKLKPTSLIPQHVILTNMLHSVCVCVCVCACGIQSFSHGQLFATPLTILPTRFPCP